MAAAAVWLRLAAAAAFVAPGFPGGARFDGTAPYATSVAGAPSLEVVFLGATFGNATGDRWNGLIALDDLYERLFAE